MLKQTPDISIVVCHHKGDFIYKFVESTKKSVGVTHEIIVVSSDDKLCEKGIVGCLVINGPQLPAAKRNLGVRIANGRYIAFFDDDVEIESDCLLELKKTLEVEHVGMVYGKLHKADEPNRFDEAGGFLTSTGFIWSRAGQNIIDSGQYDSTETIFSGKSASCMIHKRIFNYLDGFDEDFGILGEESDLAWRVWLSGYKVYYEPKAVGLHKFNTKFKPANDYYTSERVNLNGPRNYITMLVKNLGKEHLWILLPHISLWCIAGSVMILTLKIRQGVDIFRGVFHSLIWLPRTLEKRRRIQKNRVITEKQLWPYIAGRPPKGYYSQRFFRYCRIGLHG